MKKILLAVAVFLAVAAVYWPATRFDFVCVDDQEYVYENDHVLGGLTASNVSWAVRSCGYAQNWHPLAWMSLQADVSAAKRFRGEGVALPALSHVMHLHNLLLHAANAALLLLLMLRLCKVGEEELRGWSGGIPFALAALLWALHPLRTEVACWVSERKELVSVFWMLVSLICWTGRRTPVAYFLALVGCALALLAKPVAVTLPVTLLAYDWMLSRKPFARSLLTTLPFWALSVGAGLLTLSAQVEAVDIGAQYTLIDKTVMTLSAPVIYLRQTVCPIGLSSYYPLHPPTPWAELVLGAVLFIAMAWVGVRWLVRREKWAEICAFGIAWCYVSLVPMLGIVKVGDQTHSDRYTYWCGCAFVAVCVMLYKAYCKERHANAAVKTAAGVLAVMAILTLVRMPVWRNSLSLTTDCVPKSWAEGPVCALSREWRKTGDEGVERAEAMLREALTRTKYLAVRAEFAHLLAFKTEKSPYKISDGDDPAFGEVRMESMIVLENDAGNALANEAMGIVLMKEDRWKEALPYLERARAGGGDAGRLDSEINICNRHLGN